MVNSFERYCDVLVSYDVGQVHLILYVFVIVLIKFENKTVFFSRVIYFLDMLITKNISATHYVETDILKTTKPIFNSVGWSIINLNQKRALRFIYLF